jgi:hypothetical protein
MSTITVPTDTNLTAALRELWRYALLLEALDAARPLTSDRDGT